MANIVFQHLTQDQRIKARQEAGEAVQATMGERPKPELFKDTHVSKYPDWLIKLMVALCAGLLIVAFIPSAIRLWHIGSETFGEAIDSRQAMVLVGYCVVLLAEIGAILFTLAWAILETTKQSRVILGASIVASASIALVGNYEIGLVRAETVTAFTWLETLLPPLLTLSTAFILKEVALDKIKHRHADNSAYNVALKEWEGAYYHPDQHPEFDQLYANSLKDKFYQINAAGQGRSDRIALMNGFSDANWSAIIRGEMQADSWFDLDSVEDVQFLVQGVQPVRSEQPEQRRVIPQKPLEQANYTNASIVQDVVQSEASEHRSMGFAALADERSKPEQIADILKANPGIRFDEEGKQRPYRQILAYPQIAAITRSTGTLSSAFEILDGE